MVLEEKGRASKLARRHGQCHRLDTRLHAGLTEATGSPSSWAASAIYFFLRDLASAIDSDWPAVQAALERIRDTLFNRGRMVVNVTADASLIAALRPRAGELPRAACRTAGIAWPSWGVRARAASRRG